MNNMNPYFSDNQIKKRIIAEKRRKRQHLRIAIICAVMALSVIDGFFVGRLIGISQSVSSQSSDTVQREFVSTADNLPIVTSAVNEAGSENDGGSKFWSWYGYGGHVSWCACFVSWCEDQAGYLSNGYAPKFAYVPEGVDWFKSRGQWLNAGETPSAGDLIFFDWEKDGGNDHVGIVTAVVDNRVFTVEGNSSDRCRQKRYMLDDPVISGYGHITGS